MQHAIAFFYFEKRLNIFYSQRNMQGVKRNDQNDQKRVGKFLLYDHRIGIPGNYIVPKGEEMKFAAERLQSFRIDSKNIERRAACEEECIIQRVCMVEISHQYKMKMAGKLKNILCYKDAFKS